ncbi:SRPBCC family protein [Streptomyces sp. CNQ085]|uniref:SRPBCC family protein n=1 Tax=Streptomyces sp. CNQ085 TaxID=2886944 RepID=UPI001F515393|nr:SRPBCC family protein [Streptomyces sp. CNQ085]MCI0386398.1 SRPBCC family protein [Streptomyces sp. CNQ085]
MARMILRATGRVPADEVWERYARPELWPVWSPQIRSVRVRGDRIEPGMEGEVFPLPGTPVAFTVEEVHEARRRWTWRVKAGPVRMRLHHVVVVLPDGRTGTELRMEGPLPALVLYAGPARLALHRLVRAGSGA